MGRRRIIRKTKRTVLYLLSFILLFMSVGSLIYASEMIGVMSVAVQTLTIIVAILGVYAVIIQLQEQKKVQQADFVVGLNEAFVNNENYANMYLNLEEELRTGEAAEFSTIEVSNYLTFFETIYLMLNDEVVDIKTVNDLFSYRFFLAVHSKSVQAVKLVKSPKNFRNIYYLEDLWMEYRNKKGLPIHNEINCLKIACNNAGKLKEYEEIMKHYGNA